MEFPPGYILKLTQQEIERKWPNIRMGKNASYTSLKQIGHNCLAFVLGEEDKEADMFMFSKKLDLSKCGLNNADLDHTIAGYSKLLSHYYLFEPCASDEVEEGYDKIVLYEGFGDDGKIGWLHAAIQLSNGNWKSKMGWFEDIEHNSVDVVSGDFYGKPVLYMKRPTGLKIRYLENDQKII